MLKNILTDGMPDAIVVNGIPFDIYTDFRIWLRAGYMIQSLSTTKDQNEVFKEICDLVVKEYPKEYIYADDFLSALLQFYAGFPEAENENRRKEKEKNKAHPKPATFDFVFDSRYIYCSFLSFYHIRLQEIEYMHWWEFLVLFEGLMMSDATSMNYIVGARQTEIKSSMPKEEKKRIQKMKKVYALPKNENEQKMENNLVNSLMNMSKKKRGERNGKEGNDLPTNERETAV